MSHERNYDALIVGARAAGAATAMLLARAGLRVLVVDRGRYGRDTLSTHALMRGGVLQLHRWGLLDRVVSAGTPPIRRVTYQYGGSTIPIDIAPVHGVDALYAPRRTVLDPLLVDAAREAGAEVQYGVTITDVAHNGRGRIVGVDGRDEAGHRFEARARIVIGADGVGSVIADRVGAPTERRGRVASAFVYGYWSDLPTNGYEWIFRPLATAGVIPTNDGLTCVFAGTTPERFYRNGRSEFEAMLRRASPPVAERVLAGRPVGHLRTFVGRPAMLRRAWGPGWALVGDAGYWKDPITAHGITDALRDAELLARAITSSFAGDASEHEALGEYQATRDRLSIPLLDATELLATQQWTDRELAAILRSLSTTLNDEVEVMAALEPITAVSPSTSESTGIEAA